MNDPAKKSSKKINATAGNAVAHQLVDSLLRDLENLPESSTIGVDMQNENIQSAVEDSKTLDLRSLNTENTAHLQLVTEPTLPGAHLPEPTMSATVTQVGREKVVFTGASSALTLDANLAQAENLKVAQQRILDLENELEKIRTENEELASAAHIIRERADQNYLKLQEALKDKMDFEESAQTELLVLKGTLQHKEQELFLQKQKVEELDLRLKADLRKIRVRERELENRLELARVEKNALMRSKDEIILDLKRKIDQMQGEMDNYKSKCIELNKTIDNNQAQFKRTVQALRLALINLEDKQDNSLGKNSE